MMKAAAAAAPFSLLSSMPFLACSEKVTILMCQRMAVLRALDFGGLVGKN
jgi:hypothetical protein